MPDPNIRTGLVSGGHVKHERNAVPIGPVLKHVTCVGSIDELPRNKRYVWEPSPDSEEIRRHLLTLLESICEHTTCEGNPFGPPLATVVVWQLGEFRERRAAGHLQRIAESKAGIWIAADTVNGALARIREDPRRSLSFGLCPPSG